MLTILGANGDPISLCPGYALFSWHKLDSPGKRQPQLRNHTIKLACVHVYGALSWLSKNGWEKRPRPLWVGPLIGQVILDCMRKWVMEGWESESLISSHLLFLVLFPFEFLSCPPPTLMDCGQGVSPRQTLSSPSYFWSCVYHGNGKQTRTVAQLNLLFKDKKKCSL